MLLAMDTAPNSSSKWIPVVDADLCTGCAACADECDPACLVMDGGIAVLMETDACTSCDDCIPVCEVDGAIRMGLVPHAGDRSVGRWDAPAHASAGDSRASA